MGKSQPEAEPLLTPREAELYTEIEMARKIAWGQFPPMTKYNLSYVNNLWQRDADGKYYLIGVKIWQPWEKLVKHLEAKVYISGKLKGFVSLILSKSEVTGREKLPQKTIVPPIVKMARKDRVVEDWIRSIGRI